MNSATFSPCGLYRYVLTRTIDLGFIAPAKPCLFVMLNPSKADAKKNDATVRRCIGFARRETCTDLTIVNIFGLVATNPKALAKYSDPHGPDNTAHLVQQIEAHRGGLIIVAWGVHPMASPRAFESTGVLQMALRNAGALCLGMNQDGSPRHPLRLSKSEPLVVWTSQ